MSYNVALQGKQLASQSARTAIRAFRLREYPERHELTEKTFLARVEGRPNDEDLVMPIHIGWGREDSNRWALMGKGLVLPTRGSVIFRNELESQIFPSASSASAAQEEVEGDRFSFTIRGEVDAHGKFYKPSATEQDNLPAKLENLVVFANPEPEALEEMENACNKELGRQMRVFFYDRRSVGASAFARTPLDFVTDCKHTARVLGEMLSQTPLSAATLARKSGAAITLLHCAYRDPEIPSVDTYAAVSPNKIVSRGQFEPKQMLEVFAEQASKRIFKQSNSLLLRGNVTRDAKTGEVTLFVGAEAPAAVNETLQAAHHFVWGFDGVTRAWDAVLEPTLGRSTLPLQGVPHTLLAQPKRIVFAKQSGVTAAAAEGDALKQALEKSLIVAAVPGQSAELFNKLVKAHNVSLVFEK